MKSIIKIAIVLLLPILSLAVQADRTVRNFDGTPISVRMERRERRMNATARLLSSASSKSPNNSSSILAEWGVQDAGTELYERKRESDQFGRTHIRYRQIYHGVEVDARELIVHEKDGSIYEVNGEFLAGLALDVEPKRNIRGATLVVWCKGRNAKYAHLAWRVSRREKGKLYWDFSDDETGDVLESRRAGVALKIETNIDDDPDGEGGDEGDEGNDEEDKEDPFLAGMDMFEIEVFAITNAASAYEKGTPVTITGKLPWQQGGAEVSVNGIEIDGEPSFVCTNSYGTKYCLYTGFGAPCYTNEVMELLASGDTDITSATSSSATIIQSTTAARRASIRAHTS